jgi:AhpD family alkylhydroperoxidase
MSQITGLSVPPVPAEELPASLQHLAEPREGASEAANAQKEAWVGFFAHAPEHAERFFPYYLGIWHQNHLGARLTELVRLAIANTTQCPSCLQARIPSAIEEGLTEDEISYITELDRGDFSPRERAAIRFALNFGGDHHAIDEAQWAELKEVFSDEELVELCIFCATFLGTSRLAKSIGLVNATCTMPGRRLRPRSDAIGV